MSVMGADKKQKYGNHEKKLLGRRVLISVINLFPHVEIIVGSSVEFERYATNPVKHDI